MRKLNATLTAACAAVLMTAGLASAQVASKVPQAAGEATTTGAHSQPNPAVKVMKNDRTTVRQEAAAHNRMDNNSNLPKGEASTTGPSGQPNMAPAGMAANTQMKSRAERRAERNMEKALKDAEPVPYHHNGAQGTPK
jgi:hypothetical protein